ncbi:MAG: Gfo/Idh/MocA family oxidoreductase [SAR324 cluster bacterium]|nr:Gfo/Idh/MocA family oxidoreductase [SAR324 cluster bacterium]
MSSRTNPIRFGILGAGMIAEYHAQAIRENQDIGAELIAVAHYDSRRFASIEQAFGVPCMTQEELFAHAKIDAVCICTPSGQHASQAIASSEAGKHALVEKPMALSLSDADSMIAAFSEKKLSLGVVFQRRMDPVFIKIRQAISAGALGDLTVASVTIPYQRTPEYYQQASWRGTWKMDGGGVLINQGIHLIDLLVWFLGSPVGIQAYADTLQHSIEVEDSLAASLRFENGAMATVLATTTASPGFPHRIEIFGTEGAIQVEGERVLRWNLASPDYPAPQQLNLESDQSAGAGGDPRGIQITDHICMIRQFVEALQNKKSFNLDGTEGRRSLACVLGIYQAAGLLEKSEY